MQSSSTAVLQSAGRDGSEQRPSAAAAAVREIGVSAPGHHLAAARLLRCRAVCQYSRKVALRGGDAVSGQACQADRGNRLAGNETLLGGEFVDDGERRG